MSSPVIKLAAGSPDEAKARIDHHVSNAVVELFARYDLSITPTPHVSSLPQEKEVVVAVIGFAGDQMRGSLVMAAPVSAVEKWRRAIGGAEMSADVCDMLGEIANMILGRLKGRLALDGLPILMSTPTSARGPAVIVAPSSNSDWAAFRGEDWSLLIRADAVFDDDFGLEIGPVEPPAEPGAVMIF